MTYRLPAAFPVAFPAAILTLVLATGASPRLAAQPPQAPAELAALVSMADDSTPAAAAREFRAVRVDAREFRGDWTRMVREQGWHTSLSVAADRAANEGKLVFWVQALGAMTGFT